jgi:hypothetical protein
MSASAPAPEEDRGAGLRRELRFWEAIALSIAIMAPTAAMALNASKASTRGARFLRPSARCWCAGQAPRESGPNCRGRANVRHVAPQGDTTDVRATRDRPRGWGPFPRSPRDAPAEGRLST